MFIDIVGYRVDYLTGVGDCTAIEHVTYTSKLFTDTEPAHARAEALEYATSLQAVIDKDINLSSRVDADGVQINPLCHAISVYLFTTDCDLHLIYIDSNFDIILKGITEKTIAENRKLESKLYKHHAYECSEKMLADDDNIILVKTGHHLVIG